MDVIHNLEADYIAAEVVELNQDFEPNNLQGSTVVLDSKNQLELLIREPEPSTSGIPAQPKKRKKNNCDDYLKNKLVRDPYFKLDNNTYTFKETLGDWDEKSTKSLISLIGKHPKAHFLLQYYYERRLVHWENIQQAMLSSGYNFTVLQLRMRWREVLGKYRWTLNHNDLHPEATKDCEYKTDMDQLFGVWEPKHTEALIGLIENTFENSPSAKNKQLGQGGWQRIASGMEAQGYYFGVMQVEARWRMLTTLYKSMVDHNDMPTVDPIQAAYSHRLSRLIEYEPRRRKDYEKYKGKKIKLEKFPERGMRCLISIYKEFAMDFFNSTRKNADVWNDIRNELAKRGHQFGLKKMKEIFFATLKLHERSVQHNSMPGAIRREGPYFEELSNIQEVYGSWPHIRRRVKTSDEKSNKRFSIKLRESMQTWKTEESRALLQLYLSLLEQQAHSKSSGLPVKELWPELAKRFEELGYLKRDIPTVATHISLLRQAYVQGNPFPFDEEMTQAQNLEEHMNFIPDLSKYVGDTAILYWSHDAILLMLDLYLEIQPLLPFSSFSNEVHQKISREMQKHGYTYTGEDVSSELRSLLFQFTLRKHKIEKSSEETWGKQKSVAFYREKLHKVMRMREEFSVTFTNGVKPIPDDVAELAFCVAKDKAIALFQGPLNQKQQEDRMKLIVMAIRREIKRSVAKKPPVARKICFLLLSGLGAVAEGVEHDKELVSLHNIMKNYEYQSVLSQIMKDSDNGSYRLPRHILDLDRSDRRDSLSREHLLIKSESDSQPACSSEIEFFQSIPEDVCSISIKEEKIHQEDSVGISIEEALCNYSEKEDSKSVIFVDHGLSTKTTVQRATTDPNVTCINIENMI